MKGLMAALLVILQLMLMIPRQTEAQRCQCGKVNRRSRFPRSPIAGPRAQKTKANEYPWHVGIVRLNPSGTLANFGKPTCGGSIIAPRYVLTAAHCVSEHDYGRLGHRRKIREVQVVVGEHNIRDNVADRRDVSRVHLHPHYEVKRSTEYTTYASTGGYGKLPDFDFAILTLTQPLTFSSAVAPICLPAQRWGRWGRRYSHYTGQMATATGWGTTNDNGDQPATLLEAALRVGRCGARGEWKHICARGQGQGVCPGDSGGPLSVVENDRFEMLINVCT